MRNNLLEELSQVRVKNDDDGLNNFLRICRNTLDRFDPRKKKYIRGNNALFMNKTLNKEIMKTSNFRNKYLKSIMRKIKNINKEIRMNLY